MTYTTMYASTWKNKILVSNKFLFISNVSLVAQTHLAMISSQYQIKFAIKQGKHFIDAFTIPLALGLV